MDGVKICLSRNSIEKEWYGSINTRVLFLHMLLKANYCPVFYGGKMVPRGAFMSTALRIAQETGLAIAETKASIDELISTGDVTVIESGNWNIYTVNEYDQYCPPMGQIEVLDGQAYFEDVRLNQTFLDFLAMRTRLKKPLEGAREIELISRRLYRLATDDYKKPLDVDEAIAILEQSIMNGWSSIWPVKKKEKRQQKEEEWVEKWRNV